MADKSYIDELFKNNVSLQKASLELIETVNKLTERMDRLLSLFEEAAKNIEMSELKEPLAQKLDELLEQNKVIARGLVLLEKYIRERPATTGFQQSSLESRPLPKLL